jgi:hypothetical protein
MNKKKADHKNKAKPLEHTNRSFLLTAMQDKEEKQARDLPLTCF